MTHRVLIALTQAQLQNEKHDQTCWQFLPVATGRTDTSCLEIVLLLSTTRKLVPGKVCGLFVEAIGAIHDTTSRSFRRSFVPMFEAFSRVHCVGEYKSPLIFVGIG